MLNSGAVVAMRAYRDGWVPERDWSVSEWADERRVLPKKGASEPGPWRTDRTPYLREPMDCLSSSHPCEKVVLQFAIQTGKSECGLNFLGNIIDLRPAPTLVVLPTILVGERWSRQRFQSMIDATPSLRAKIGAARSRDSNNTVSMKETTDGAIIIIAGSNSAASLSSMPIQFLICDEVDRFSIEVDGEGDPIDIALGRTSTFWRRKIVLVSSPTIESLSRINKEYQASDQRRYFVPCPHCDHMQTLEFDHISYPEGQPQEARYACEGCGALIDHHEKTRMLERGEWRATFPERDVPGFQLSGLYSPVGLGRTWADHAKHWEQIKRDPVRVKTFTNQVLGLTFADENERMDWEALKSRAAPYKVRTIPVGFLLLTAGVDVQGDRLEMQIVAWGRGEVSAVIDWHVISGDPTRPEVWAALDEYLARPIRNEFGIEMRITSTGVDSGYLTDDVLNYTRSRKARGIFALKGASTRGRQIISRPGMVDVNWRGQTIKKGAEMWTIGGDTAKTRLFARLKGDAKYALATDRMVQFSDELPDDYYMQLCAEVYDPNTRRWVKMHGRRNEALDTYVYAMAAAMHPRVKVHAMRDSDWERLEALYQPGEAAPPAAPPPDIMPMTQIMQPARPSRGGWVRGWRP